MILKQHGHENTDLCREKQERKIELPIELNFESFNFWPPSDGRTLESSKHKECKRDLKLVAHRS